MVYAHPDYGHVARIVVSADESIQHVRCVGADTVLGHVERVAEPRAVSCGMESLDHL